MIDVGSSCRLCLGKGAHYPIFVKENTEDVFDKITWCLNEKLEDKEGYPKNICAECNNTINIIYKFKDKYKQCCKILENEAKGVLKIKVENSDSDLETEEHFLYIADTCKKPKLEPELKCDTNSYKNMLTALTEITVKKKCTNDINIEKSKTVTSKARKPKNTVNLIKSKQKDGLMIDKKERNRQIKEKILNYKKKKKETIAKELINNQRQQTETDKPETQKEQLPHTPRLCDKCGQTFDKYKDLVKHKSTHPKETFKCDKCPRTYRRKSSLTEHVQKFHEKIKKASCHQCGMAFFAQKDVLSHVRVVHENKKKKTNLKEYKCRFCEKAYCNKRLIICHERSVHTGERPAICSVCNSAFLDVVYLREHMRLHTGHTPFKCPVCNRGYTQLGNMKSHLRNHRISELSPEILNTIRPNHLKFLRP